MALAMHLLIRPDQAETCNGEEKGRNDLVQRVVYVQCGGNSRKNNIASTRISFRFVGIVVNILVGAIIDHAHGYYILSTHHHPCHLNDTTDLTAPTPFVFCFSSTRLPLFPSTP